MSVTHATFSIERRYKASPARVFASLSDPAKKRRWFAENDGFEASEFSLDFRIGGVERSRFVFKGGAEGAPPAGTTMSNDTVYQDIVPDARIVLAYTMSFGIKRISASLATFELIPEQGGTRLVFTEQGAYFDGADSAAMRQDGWERLLVSLQKEVDGG